MRDALCNIFIHTKIESELRATSPSTTWRSSTGATLAVAEISLTQGAFLERGPVILK